MLIPYIYDFFGALFLREKMQQTNYLITAVCQTNHRQQKSYFLSDVPNLLRKNKFSELSRI